MLTSVDHIAGSTWHGRKGDIRNAFRYNVDFLLLDAEKPVAENWIFSRTKTALFSLRDKDHGGPPAHGRGAAWVREVTSAHNLPVPARIELLAQPRVLGYVFNPVSFWLCWDDEGGLRTVIAEVTNTYGDRHSYLCARDDHGPIQPQDRLVAQKIMHVSPFQRVNGGYVFTFNIGFDRIAICIDFTDGNGGVTATLVGPRTALRQSHLLWAFLRRPLGTRRVMALIHWQALKLWWKGAIFRARPEAPTREVSR